MTEPTTTAAPAPTAPAPAGRGAGAVQSVDRAIDLLEAMARSDRPMGVGELAAATGLAQGTAHRLLRTLQARGYVRHDAARKYSLGASAFVLGDAAQRSLARSARPHLTELVRLCGETANLAVLEGDEVVYLAQVPSPHSLRMFAEVGRHVPAHTTAVGKVLLAAMPPERAMSLLARTGLAPMTPNSITDTDEFLRVLAATRERGWAADEGEQELGVRCAAVPVGKGEDVVAAMSVSGPAERFAGVDSEGLLEQMARIAEDFAGAVMGVPQGPGRVAGGVSPPGP